MRRIWLWFAPVVALLIVCAPVISGCGGSDSKSTSETQLEQAKEEGERVAQERARVDELEREVRNLKRSAQSSKRESSTPAAPVTSAPPSGGRNETDLLRTFHAPSGNVSCGITSTGAYCTVDSISTTFRVEDGGPGLIETGSALPRTTGELAGYGSVVSAGAITCTVPEADEPRGITCVDTSSGHGFEASRISSRQNAY